MNTPQSQPVLIAETEPYAGFWRRFFAHLLDQLIIQTVIALTTFGLTLIGVLAIMFVLPKALGHPTVTYYLRAIVFIAELGIWWLYFAGFEASQWQATPGKLVFQLKVTDMQGERLTLGKATHRNLGKVLSSLLLCVGYLLIAFTLKKQAWHDLMAGTLVLKKIGK